MSAVEDRLAEIKTRLMFTNGGQTNTDDVPALLAALRAVLDLAQHHYGFTVDHDNYGTLGDIARAAIGSALGVSYDEL